MKRRNGDRRLKPRFEIVGELWGSVDVNASLAVVNLGRGGALLESPVPLTPGAMYSVQVVTDTESHRVTMRVRHSVASAEDGSTGYLVGVEFVDVTTPLDEFLARQLALGSGGLPVEAGR
jgi:hypothetical protein